MQCTDDNQGEVHAKVEHLKQLRFGRGEDDDAADLRQCDAAKDLDERHMSMSCRPAIDSTRTELPMSASAKRARSNRLAPGVIEKYRAMCAQNSTAMPTD